VFILADASPPPPPFTSPYPTLYPVARLRRRCSFSHARRVPSSSRALFLSVPFSSFTFAPSFLPPNGDVPPSVIRARLFLALHLLPPSLSLSLSLSLPLPFALLQWRTITPSSLKRLTRVPRCFRLHVGGSPPFPLSRQFCLRGRKIIWHNREAERRILSGRTR
jgi:hypothetical protein